MHRNVLAKAGKLLETLLSMDLLFTKYVIEALLVQGDKRWVTEDLLIMPALLPLRVLMSQGTPLCQPVSDVSLIGLTLG